MVKKNHRELHFDQSDYLPFQGWLWRLVSNHSGYIWLTGWQTAFKYLTHKKISVFLLFFSWKCWMCMKMRKIIFRIDMTFLVHKSREIASRREYYFFCPNTGNYYFPFMFIFWCLISPFFCSFFFFCVLVVPFIPLAIKDLLGLPIQEEAAHCWCGTHTDLFSVEGGLKSSLILLSSILPGTSVRHSGAVWAQYSWSHSIHPRWLCRQRLSMSNR